MNKVQGQIVRVDWSLCFGCEKCILACPTHVFVNTEDETGKNVVNPAGESDCILCLVCEIVCPVNAITIIHERGSEDTLQSLLQGTDRA